MRALYAWLGFRRSGLSQVIFSFAQRLQEVARLLWVPCRMQSAFARRHGLQGNDIGMKTRLISDAHQNLLIGISGTEAIELFRNPACLLPHPDCYLQ